MADILEDGYSNCSRQAYLQWLTSISDGLSVAYSSPMSSTVLDIPAACLDLARGCEAAERRDMGTAAALLSGSCLAMVGPILAADPGQSPLIHRVITALRSIGSFEQAEWCCRQVLEHHSDAAVYNTLGSICQYTGRILEGIEYQRRALDLCPDSPELQANLARALLEAGRTDEGILLLRTAVQRMPNHPAAHSNLLFRLHQQADITPEPLFTEHLEWARRHTSTIPVRTDHPNDPDPDRRLRVGYLSPDFRRNSVAYFFESLLDGHDLQAVETFGYANVECPDEVTDRLKDKFCRYRSIYGLDDSAAARLIEDDQIDILVDLAGHVGDNRLLVMARRSAPIQVTYLGYPDTTGMRAIDYRLTDPVADLLRFQCHYTEQLLMLPDGFLCYRPPDFAPDVGPLSAAATGRITFGSFNNSAKINRRTVELWSAILANVPGSSLLLKIKGGDEPSVREYFAEPFIQQGLSADRIRIVGWRSPVDHLASYNQVDIALDTYPYNGTTTTCEALWMGVPVITLSGVDHHLSRVGLSILTRLKLEFFAAATPREYIAKAVSLAQNIDALARIRSSMRARIAVSGLCHARAFARQVEGAYRHIWRQWCAGHRHVRL